MKSQNRMETTGKTARSCWNELKSDIAETITSLRDLRKTLTDLSKDSDELADLCDAMGHGWIDLSESLEKTVKYSEPENNEIQ